MRVISQCSEVVGNTSEYKAEHKPSGYGLYVKSDYQDTFKSYYDHETFDGDIAEAFVKKLIKIRDDIDEISSHEMIFSEQDWESFKNASTCWICNEGFTKDAKVRDHRHFSGKYRGAAHNGCNLKLRKKKFIPVIFHNLKGYDSHLFIRAFSKLEEKIKCIPQNTEKFITFSLSRLVHQS